MCWKTEFQKFQESDMSEIVGYNPFLDAPYTGIDEVAADIIQIKLERGLK